MKSTPRPAVIIDELPRDTLLVSFGYDSPHPPECVRVEHFTRVGKGAQLTKPTHFRGARVIRREDVTKVCASCPTHMLLKLEELFETRYSDIRAAESSVASTDDASTSSALAPPSPPPAIAQTGEVIDPPAPLTTKADDETA